MLQSDLICHKNQNNLDIKNFYIISSIAQYGVFNYGMKTLLSGLNQYSDFSEGFWYIACSFRKIVSYTWVGSSYIGIF